MEAFRWALLNSLAGDAISDQPGCSIIRYEDLCTDPESVTESLLASLNLSPSDQLLGFLRRSTSNTSPRFYGIYREKVSVDQWRGSFPESIQDRVSEIVRDTAAGRLYFGS